MKENSQKKKKKPVSGLVAFFVIMLIANISTVLEEMPRHSRTPVIFALVVLVVTVILVAVVVKAATRRAAAGQAVSRPVTPAPRTVPAHGAARPKATAYTEGPDAYCLVCDQTGIDHFERDRLRRLRQLDYWLSIGLIERGEYNTLREKYSRGTPHQGGR